MLNSWKNNMFQTRTRSSTTNNDHPHCIYTLSPPLVFRFIAHLSLTIHVLCTLPLAAVAPIYVYRYDALLFSIFSVHFSHVRYKTRAFSHKWRIKVKLFSKHYRKEENWNPFCRQFHLSFINIKIELRGKFPKKNYGALSFAP